MSSRAMSSYPGRLSFTNAPASSSPRVPAFGRQSLIRTRTFEVQETRDSSPETPARRSRFRLRDHLARQRTNSNPGDLEAGIPENSQAPTTSRPPINGQSDIPMPEPTVPPNRRPSRRFTGSENPELRLSQRDQDGAESQTRRKRGFRSGRNTQGRDGNDKSPKHFMFCFPWVKSQEARRHIMRSVVSGIFTALLLGVYLSITISHKFQKSEFSVLLILMMLTSTVIFCHSLVRACSMILRPDKETTTNTLYNVHGYAIPERPIPVVLARDEEAAGVESSATKLNPPAYGLWRSSVRVDPNALYWQRNPNARRDEPPMPQSAPRPPSYASDDGVAYVVDAVPRSTVPTEDVPLPPHPSEVNRLNGNDNDNGNSNGMRSTR